MLATIRCIVLHALVSACIALPGLAIASSDQADTTNRHYEGIAYADGSQRVLYREEHWVYEDHGIKTRLVLYRCPAGTPFARKLVRKIPDSFAPDFDFFDSRDGYREGVRSHDGAREIYVQKNAQASVETKPLPARSGGVIDAAFDAYVQHHWDELSEKRDLHLPFLIPSRFAYLDLKLGGAIDDIENDIPVRHFKMRLDAWFGALIPSIDLTYTKAKHRLLRFQGIGNIRDDAGKSQSVHIEFPATRQFGPPTTADIDNAAAIPLTGRCPT